MQSREGYLKSPKRNQRERTLRLAACDTGVVAAMITLDTGTPALPTEYAGREHRRTPQRRPSLHAHRAAPSTRQHAARARAAARLTRKMKNMFTKEPRM